MLTTWLIIPWKPISKTGLAEILQDNPDQGFADIAQINRTIYDYQEQLAR